MTLEFCPLVFLQLSFGGMPYSGKPLGGGRKNFKGCMESINYNGDNITDLARRKKLDTSSFVSKPAWSDQHSFCYYNCRVIIRGAIMKIHESNSSLTDPSLTSTCVCLLSLFTVILLSQRLKQLCSALVWPIGPEFGILNTSLSFVRPSRWLLHE